MVVYGNGQIPTSALTQLRNFPGAYLRADAENSFARVQAEVRRRYGWTPTLTSAGDAYRSLERQITVFLSRYRTAYSTYDGRRVDKRGPWRGLYWYRYQGAAAAVPGFSNHGKGTTVDIKDIGGFSGTRYRQFKDVAEENGWSNDEGISVNEPWHWSYNSNRDVVLISNPGIGNGVTIDVPSIDPIDPLTPKDDDMRDIRLVQHDERGWCLGAPGFWRVINSDEELEIAKAFYGPAEFFNARQVDLFRALCLNEMVTVQHSPQDMAEAVWAKTVRRGDQHVPALQELADAKTIADEVRTHVKTHLP